MLNRGAHESNTVYFVRNMCVCVCVDRKRFDEPRHIKARFIFPLGFEIFAICDEDVCVCT